MLIRPPQHDTWPGKPSTVLVCCTCQYTETTTLHRVSYVIERHQRQMPMRVLLWQHVNIVDLCLYIIDIIGTMSITRDTFNVCL